MRLRSHPWGTFFKAYLVIIFGMFSPARVGFRIGFEVLRERYHYVRTCNEPMDIIISTDSFLHFGADTVMFRNVLTVWALTRVSKLSYITGLGWNISAVLLLWFEI